jgi:hypothetical protein
MTHDYFEASTVTSSPLTRSAADTPLTPQV